MKSTLVAQFHRPHGWLGVIAGWTMSLRPSNRERIARAVEELDISPGQRVLEIGCGPGLGIRLACQAGAELVVGLDHSATMLRQARRRNRSAIRRGQAQLVIGSYDDLDQLAASCDAFGEPFDRIFAVNALHFSSASESVLRAIRSRLTAHGTLAITHQPRLSRSARADARRFADQTTELLGHVGLGSTRTVVFELEPAPAVCILACAD